MYRAPLLTGLLLLVSCSSSTGVSTYINIGIQNSSNVELRVSILAQIGEGAGKTVSAPPGYSSTEINGSSGTTVRFTVSGPGGLAGTGSCVATNQIVGTSEYGQVTLLAGATVVQVLCQTGWQ